MKGQSVQRTEVQDTGVQGKDRTLKLAYYHMYEEQLQWEDSTEQRETREAGTHTEVWSCLSKQLKKDLEHLEQINAKQEQ